MVEVYTKTGQYFKLESIKDITTNHQDLATIGFQDYTDDDLAWVKSNFHLDLSIMNHIEDIEISSHFQQNETQSAFHFSLPYYKQKDVMVEESMFLILTQNMVFGFSSSSLDNYFTEIYSHKFDLRKNKFHRVEDLFKFQIEFLADHYADITENIARRVKQLAARVLVKKEFQEADLDIITQLNFNNILIKESINEFVRILTLQKKSLGSFNINVKDKIDEELNDLSVVTDYIQFNFDRLDDLKENISNKIELEQNKIFKLLTVVTFCISIPTLIAGIYGMNFEVIPGRFSNYGFAVTLVVMFCSVLIPLVYFKKRKWF